MLVLSHNRGPASAPLPGETPTKQGQDGYTQKPLGLRCSPRKGHVSRPRTGVPPAPVSAALGAETASRGYFVVYLLAQACQSPG